MTKPQKFEQAVNPAVTQFEDDALERIGGGADLSIKSGAASAQLDDNSSRWVRVSMLTTSGG